jgi:hypothetical protein
MGIANSESYVPSPTDIGLDLVTIYEFKEIHPLSDHG